jgi:sulfate adenylyltransferase subunit 2
MYTFRDAYIKEVGAKLIVYRNEKAIRDGAAPWKLGTVGCCALLKTQALLNALRENNFDVAIGGARREEEKSRAKERVFSFRDQFGQWDPKNQRPELWNLYNAKHQKGESIRAFPLSNWTEVDIWNYIHTEKIPVNPLYYAKEREVVERGAMLIPLDGPLPLRAGEKPKFVKCRFRSLGCYPCTGAVRSDADTLEKIIEELLTTRSSERVARVIDHDQEGSMEDKKKEGYF